MVPFRVSEEFGDEFNYRHNCETAVPLMDLQALSLTGETLYEFLSGLELHSRGKMKPGNLCCSFSLKSGVTRTGHLAGDGVHNSSTFSFSLATFFSSTK